MKDLIPDSFLIKQLEIKGVTHFFNKEKGHFHVCIHNDGSYYFFVMCRSSENIINRIKKGIIDKNTVIFLKEDLGINLTAETVIDCNNVHTFTESQLLSKIRNNELDFKGKASDNLYKEILKAVTISDLVEEETKEKIYNLLRKI